MVIYIPEIVMDTSSLISLKVIDILEIASENIQITITSIIMEELKKMSKTSDREGKAAKEILELISEEKISVVEVNSKDKVQEITSPQVDEGEASCIVCCQEKEIKNLVMDDINAASKLEGRAISKGIQQKISVAIIIELMKKKIITKEKAISLINELKKSRDWKGGVLEVLADKYLKKD